MLSDLFVVVSSEECNYGTNLTVCASVFAKKLKNPAPSEMSASNALAKRWVCSVCVRWIGRSLAALQHANQLLEVTMAGSAAGLASSDKPRKQTYKKGCPSVLPRFYVGDEMLLQPGARCELPDGAARHVQVLRMQPGGLIQLFDGKGKEHLARVTEMGRKQVTVDIEHAAQADRELPVKVTLAMGMPANDRMDALVEKATELGVHAIQPLVCERAVLRLDGERALKKVAHWQAVAISACEQSGRAFVPEVRPIQTLHHWLRNSSLETECTNWHKGVLSLREAVSLPSWLHDRTHIATMPRITQIDQAVGASLPGFIFLSGPEGGLSPAEELAALDAGWSAITLGARVLRADTAPLVALSVIGATFESRRPYCAK